MERQLQGRSMRTLGIVGGGRWAQIIDRVANANSYTTQFYTHNTKVGSVDNLLNLDSNHIWIANSPDNHYASAVELLSDHRHLLVEKLSLIHISEPTRLRRIS